MFKVVEVQEVKVEKKPYVKGSGCDYWNVDLDGKPFGQIRKFRDTKTCSHPYTAIALNGEFAHKPTLNGAIDFMRGLM